MLSEEEQYAKGRTVVKSVQDAANEKIVEARRLLEEVADMVATAAEQCTTDIEQEGFEEGLYNLYTPMSTVRLTSSDYDGYVWLNSWERGY